MYQVPSINTKEGFSLQKYQIDTVEHCPSDGDFYAVLCHDYIRLADDKWVLLSKN